MTALLLLLALQQVEVEVEARIVRPKFRLRDGEKSLKGQSVFSRELDAEDDVFSPGFRLGASVANERFHAEFWQLTAEGDGRLDESKAWGGATVPPGTVSDTEVLFRHVELGWRHRVTLDPVWLDLGVDLESLVVDADLGFGRTRLGGLFPTPQVTAGVRPLEWLEVNASIGGFFVPFRSGDTSVLDPVEYRLEARVLWDRFSLGVGYDLYHVHLEEDSGHTQEDVVHLRLRAIGFALEVRF